MGPAGDQMGGGKALARCIEERAAKLSLGPEFVNLDREPKERATRIGWLT